MVALVGEAVVSGELAARKLLDGLSELYQGEADISCRAFSCCSGISWELAVDGGEEHILFWKETCGDVKRPAGESLLK